MYSKAQPWGITLDIIQWRNSLTSFFFKFFFFFLNDLLSDDSVGNRDLTHVTKNWNKMFMN